LAGVAVPNLSATTTGIQSTYVPATTAAQAVLSSTAISSGLTANAFAGPTNPTLTIKTTAPLTGDAPVALNISAPITDFGTATGAQDQIQTLNFSGSSFTATASAGAFTLTFGSVTTGSISESNSPGLLASSIQTALNTSFGTGNTLVAVTTATAITITFTGSLAGTNEPLGTFANNNDSDAISSIVISQSGFTTSATTKTSITTLGTGVADFTNSTGDTYTGSTNVSGGTLLVDGKVTSSPITVNSGGILGGTGTIGSGASASTINVLSGGELAPGTGGSPGTSGSFVPGAAR
jgi:hypothetical protein